MTAFGLRSLAGSGRIQALAVPSPVVVLLAAFACPGGAVGDGSAYERQLADVREIKRRTADQLTLRRLPHDGIVYRQHVSRLDDQVDRLLGVAGGYEAVYGDVGQTPVSHNGQAWATVRTLAVAFRTPGSRHEGSAAVLRAAERGLRHLAQFAHPGCPQPGNWWAWQIGMPMQLIPTLLLLEGDLGPDLLREQIDTVIYLLDAEAEAELSGAHVPSEEPRQGNSDTNALWRQALRLQLGVLLENPAMAGKWSELAFSEIAPRGEGHLQADGSYKFHGPIPMWAYGNSFLTDCAKLIETCHDTCFGPNAEQLDLFRDMAESFVREFLYRGRISPAMIGRTLTRSDRHHYISAGPSGLTALASAVGAGHPDARRLAAVIAREREFFPVEPYAWQKLATGFASWDNQAEILNPLGARLALSLEGVPPADPAAPVNDIFAYPDSDFLQVTRPDWALSIKMHSSRNRAYESINGENLQGWFLSHGSMFHFMSGEEWDGCWPTLDWTRLPGATIAAEVRGGSTSPFAGVLRASDRIALAAMELTSGDFRARKSWVVDEDCVVCLGSAIEGPGRVETTVVQQRVASDAPIWIDGAAGSPEPFDIAAEAHWLWLEGMGYVFPGGCRLRIIRESRTSDWSTVRDPVRYGRTDPVTHDYLTAVIVHETPASWYRYVVLPDVALSEMGAQADAVLRRYDLAHDPSHRVTARDGSFEAIVFWDAGVESSVRVDRGCLVLRVGDRLSIVDPTWSDAVIRLQWNSDDHGVTPTSGRPVEVGTPS